MKNKILLFLLSFFLLACSRKDQQVIDNNENSGYNVNYIEMDRSINADTLYFRFNILDKKTTEKDDWGELAKNNIEIVSGNKEAGIDTVRKLKNSKGSIPGNILVSLLVDRSIHSDEMEKIRDAVNHFVKVLPEHTVYISFFDDQLGDSKEITSENFDVFQKEFTVTGNNKIIFDAALKKFQELCGENGFTSDSTFIKKIRNEAVKKYLVLLTDGRVDANNQKTADNIQRFSEYVQKLDNNSENKNHIEIHAIRYGDKNDDVDNTLSYLCVDIRNKDVKGGLYIAVPDEFIEKLKVSDKSFPDYELAMTNPEGKIYYGQRQELGLMIHANAKAAYGQTKYAIGSLLQPVKTGAGGLVGRLVPELLFGIILLGITFLILQIIIPFIRFKIENFDKKQVRKYSFENDTILQCHYCKDEIRDGDEIVTKCRHIVHKHCWKENGYKCADYPENCKEGKQYFFDMKKPFNKENQPYFTMWALYGMAGGLLSWLIYQLLTYFIPYPFESLTKKLLSAFYPGNIENPVSYLQSVFYLKIGSLLLAGLLLGFILALLFSCFRKYKRKKHDSTIWILLKSISGALSGFLVFLIGAILILSVKADSTNVWIEWIPWIIFGCLLGICLLLRTATVWKHILLGGLISGFVCFIVLLTGKWFGIYSVLLGFMLFGAGMGISFISSRRTIHKYFIKFKGNKESKVAIYKWMSVAGGSMEVTVGKSENCTISMSWDVNPSIQDVHIKLYIDKKDKVPCLKVLADNMIYNGKIAKKNDEFLLKQGVKFKIGNTEFQYIENN